MRESAESQKEEEESKVSPQEGEKGYKQQWNLHSDFKGGETTEASSIWNKQAMVESPQQREGRLLKHIQLQASKLQLESP